MGAGWAMRRLAIKTMPSTVLTIAASQPRIEMRAARRPVASKKTGLFAMACF